MTHGGRLTRAWAKALKLAPLRTTLASMPSSPEMRRLHTVANDAAFRDRGPLFRQSCYLLERLTWPITCAALCLRRDDRLKPAIEHRGTTRLRYLFSQWVTCVRLRIPPREYLHFALHDAERLRQVGDYLFDIENYRIVGRLNEGVDKSVLQDKVKFLTVCRHHGLPSPDILAICSGGRLVNCRSLDDPCWRTDLFGKPRGAKAGSGARRWRWNGDTHVEDGGAPVSLHDLLESVRLGGDDYIIQPALRNDPDTEQFTNGSLSTARIMTGRRPNGEVALIAAFFRMARGEQIVDNISAGGLMCTIDRDSGALSAANRRWDPYSLMDRHPDTGIRFAGRRLAQWEEMVDLCRRGHAAFPGFAFVSWDVAPTPDGPVIVEGNHHGGTVAFQELNGQPMARTPFADICLAWLSPGDSTRASSANP